MALQLRQLFEDRVGTLRPLDKDKLKEANSILSKDKAESVPSKALRRQLRCVVQTLCGGGSANFDAAHVAADEGPIECPISADEKSTEGEVSDHYPTNELLEAAFEILGMAGSGENEVQRTAQFLKG